MYKVLIAIVFLMSAVSSQQARAQDVLTEDMIRAYFDRTVELYSAVKPDIGKIAEYADEDLEEGAVYKTSATSNYSDRVITTEQTKAEYMASLRNNSAEMFNSSISYTITGIDFAPDRRSAVVKFTSLLNATGRKVDPEKGGVFDIDFKALSDCDEKFRVDEAGKLRRGGGSCVLDIIYEKPVPVR